MRITATASGTKGGLNRVWITDVTYPRCAHGWVYLCAVRDAHSRRVLGYAMGEQHNKACSIVCVSVILFERIDA